MICMHVNLFYSGPLCLACVTSAVHGIVSCSTEDDGINNAITGGAADNMLGVICMHEPDGPLAGTWLYTIYFSPCMY